MVLKWKNPNPLTTNTAIHKNTAPYSPLVHNGYVSRGGDRKPPRPWMTDAYEGFDVPEFFAFQYQNQGESLSKAFRSTAFFGNRRMIANIKESKWAWPNETRRRNGQTVRSPRDIVDTQTLLKSQKPVEFTNERV